MQNAFGLAALAARIPRSSPRSRRFQATLDARSAPPVVENYVDVLLEEARLRQQRVPGVNILVATLSPRGGLRLDSADGSSGLVSPNVHSAYIDLPLPKGAILVLRRLSKPRQRTNASIRVMIDLRL